MNQYGALLNPWEVQAIAEDIAAGTAPQQASFSSDYNTRTILIWAGAGVLGFALYKYMTRRKRK